MYMFYVGICRYINTFARDGCGRACGCTASHAHVRATARIVCIYVFICIYKYICICFMYGCIGI